MKPNRSFLHSQFVAVSLLAATLLGCASFKDSNETIIHVNTAQDPAKARRLTLAGVHALDYGGIDRAFLKFNEAIAADPAYGPAHNNLGLLLYDQGNLYEAVLAFEQALDLMPNDPAVYYNLGLTLETAGRTFEALDLYVQAVEMDPSNPNYLGNLCRLRVRMGEDDPTLVTQLQDLVLIETRPQWRQWADRELALNFNIALDRGPPAPEFNTGTRGSGAEGEDAIDDNIIDLSPATPDEGDESSSRRVREEIDPPADMLLQPSVQSIPLPAEDGLFETLPPSRSFEPANVSDDYFQ